MKRTPIQIRVPVISDKQSCCPYNNPFGYIYKITNKLNGHYYIGKHEFHHPWLDKNYKGSGKRLQVAYNKYGEENFDIIVLEWTDRDNDELNKMEKYWIDIFKAFEFPCHYNLTEGGDGASLQGERNPFYNKHHSEETCLKLKKSWDYNKHFGSGETQYKMSENKIGERNSFYNKHHSEETKSYLRKINSGENNYWFGKRGKDSPNYGHHWNLTEETKEKLRKNIGDQAGGNNLFAKKVRIIETGEILDCIKSAMEFLQVGEWVLSDRLHKNIGKPLKSPVLGLVTVEFYKEVTMSELP